MATPQSINRIGVPVEKISNLVFLFPQNETDFFRVVLPFFENPQIKESKKANWIEYDIISRSSQLFSYTGAKARELKIDFTLTIPHIVDLAKKQKSVFRGASERNKGDLKQLFFKKPFDTEEINTEENPFGNAKRFYDITRILGNIDQLEDNERQRDQQEALNILAYWINIIRSSVINNAKLPSLGPPIIRLNYGLLYQNIPCICTDYSVSYENETTGYDERTMVPRQLMISMSLKEIRSGNFGEYNFRNVIERDNLTGWESVINSPYTLDPMNFDGGPRGELVQDIGGINIV